jgi:lysophospholipid acyltransferase (LPLAT)-like uncharacterized protein
MSSRRPAGACNWFRGERLLMLRRLLRHPASQAGFAWLLGGYLALVFRTTRWTLLGEDHLRAAFQPSGPEAGEDRPLPGAIGAFWHERLPMMPMLWLLARRLLPALGERRTHVLVSRHRDGRFIGTIVRRFRLEIVHASSSRGGATGMRVLLRALAAGDSIAITPDGPRGPRRRAAPGVAMLAALSGRRCYPARRGPGGPGCSAVGTAWCCRCPSAAASSWWAARSRSAALPRSMRCRRSMPP